MGRRARTIPPVDSSASRDTYQETLAKLRRTRAAVQRTVSECEDYLAHGDERRKAREPEPVE